MGIVFFFTQKETKLDESKIEPTVKITRINDRWHARLMIGEKVCDEMACELKVDIGYICRTMLRWYDKTGGMSQFAHKSRFRKVHRGPVGEIWYQAKLNQEKAEIAAKKALQT